MPANAIVQTLAARTAFNFDVAAVSNPVTLAPTDLAAVLAATPAVFKPVSSVLAFRTEESIKALFEFTSLAAVFLLISAVFNLSSAVFNAVSAFSIPFVEIDVSTVLISVR